MATAPIHRCLAVTAQQTSYAKNGDVNIAYQALKIGETEPMLQKGRKVRR